MLLYTTILFGLFIACQTTKPTDTGEPTCLWYMDVDGDGFGSSADSQMAACDATDPTYVNDDTDCDDTNADRNPQAVERCDGVDNDCDGAIDDGLTETWYQDGDGDGYGDATTTIDACAPGEGWVASGDDCNDGDAIIHPGQDEACNGADDDCDGLVDDADVGDVSGRSTWYLDADADGWGSTSTVDACVAPDGYTASSGDCDDTQPAIYPGATEVCDGLDNDCDGTIDDPDASDATAWYADQDNDGYGDSTRVEIACDAPDGYVVSAGDCQPTDARTYPGAPETDCTDPNDYNCDGVVVYADDDGDGWAACVDCDDTNAGVSPSEAERCDAIDNDCDGVTDEADALDAATWYADDDGDGYGALPTVSCNAPTGTVAIAGDCNDADSNYYPDAPEADCTDPNDYNCDGVVVYADADADSWAACEDCDDLGPTINPDGVEVCDGADNNCDGAIDEDTAIDAVIWYDDPDGDGWGGDARVACAQPEGYATATGDCDNTNAMIFPGATEVCDGTDNDCDSIVDEDATDAPTWYVDADGDSYGSISTRVNACAAPTGYVTTFDDCDDANSAIFPSATEVCDDADNDCDSLIDEDDAVDAPTWYADTDGDGYGDAPYTACVVPAGYVAQSGDCDDADPQYYPDAPEDCADPNDYSCDGLITYADADSDGWAACEECDDNNEAIRPDAEESCDGLDNNCDGQIDTGCPVSLGDISTVWWGEGAGELAGWSVAGAGDVDGDTRPDFLVSAIQNSDGAFVGGAVYLMRGASVSSSGSLATADARFLGENANDYLGRAIAGAGDVNADGLDDILIGAAYYDSSESGRTYLFLGQDASDPLQGDISVTTADAWFLGEGYGDYAGDAVAGVGDVNGDGFDDLLIGANRVSTGGTNAGAAYLLIGPKTGELDLSAADAKLIGENASHYAGSDVSGAGDVDGDGLADMLVSARGADIDSTDSGAIYLIYGRDGADPLSGDIDLSLADARLYGGTSDQVRVVANAGDADGDGLDDLLVGTTYEDYGGSNTGAAFLVLAGGAMGPLIGDRPLYDADAIFTGENTDDYVGFSVSAGDVNADGTPDVVLGAYGLDSVGTDAGATYVIYGPRSGTLALGDADAALLGVAERDYAGYDVDIIGDINGDFREDLLIGAYGDDTAGGSAGAAYLVLGMAWSTP